MQTPYVSERVGSDASHRAGLSLVLPHHAELAHATRDFFTFLRDINKTHNNSVKTIAIVHESTLWGQEFAESGRRLLRRVRGVQEVHRGRLSAGHGRCHQRGAETDCRQARCGVPPLRTTPRPSCLRAPYKQYGFNPQGILAIGASFGSNAARCAAGPDANYFFVREHWSRDLADRNPLVGQIAKMYRDRYGKDTDGTPAAPSRP